MILQIMVHLTRLTDYKIVELLHSEALQSFISNYSCCLRASHNMSCIELNVCPSVTCIRLPKPLSTWWGNILYSFPVINPNKVVRHKAMLVEVEFDCLNIINRCTLTFIAWAFKLSFINITFLLIGSFEKLFNPSYESGFQTTSTIKHPIILPITTWRKWSHDLCI